MSLKAKIEAVIYASEEPVTLAQLVGLLGEFAQLDGDGHQVAQIAGDRGMCHALGNAHAAHPWAGNRPLW